MIVTKEVASRGRHLVSHANAAGSFRPVAAAKEGVLCSSEWVANVCEKFEMI